ncbi:MAG: signal peptidase I [Gammaproteobacteria bacterium]|nr:signal peptidase I [Gammaproteobacteria bacterium]
MDFSFVLVAITGLALVLWLTDRLVVAPKHKRAVAVGGEPRPRAKVFEYAAAFLPVLLIVLCARSFLYEPYRIPSGSMRPTLEVGDFIFVNKFVYGLRLPVTNTRIVELGSPRRGDVVVFKLPSDSSANFIKRLVGLPGDVIEYRNKRLSINGEPVQVDMPMPRSGESPFSLRQAEEMLGGARHDIYFMPGQRGREGVFEVPAGHYFVMGDNRDNSRDSRYPGVGFIPEHRLVGRAERIWFNWAVGSMPEWSRIGDPIR